MVTCNNYRNPALLAKMASTVDVMSHGRLDFGIGAGWYEEEYRAYGYPYPDGPERLRMLDEALQIIRAMWTEDYATFEGKYYQVRGAINEPKGVQKPHPPIWVGGGGEQVTLKLVAKYGDACNITGDNARRGPATSSMCCASTATPGPRLRQHHQVAPHLHLPAGTGRKRRGGTGRPAKV